MKSINNKLYITGYFDGTLNTVSENIIYYDGTWNSMNITNYGNAWFSPCVYDIRGNANDLFMVGMFDSINNLFASGFAYYSNSNWATFSSTINNAEAVSIEFYKGDIYVSGRIEFRRYDSTLFVQSITNKNMLIDIYPNPSNGNFTIKKQTDGQAQITVHDLVGNLIFSSTINNKTSVIDLTSLARSLYSITITEGENTHTQKIVVN
jgi:hypothetical protein